MNRMAAQPLGGPLGSTRTVSILMFNTLYAQNRAGQASAIAVILAIVIFAMTLLQRRIVAGRGGEV